MSIVQDLDELNDLQKLSLIDMSYSRLDMFQNCQAKYFYSYIQKEPRGFGAAAAMGTAVHSTLEKTDLNNMDEEDMLSRLELELVHEEETQNGVITDELKQAGREIITEFVDRHDGDHFDIIDSELEFSFIMGNCKFKGYIDRVDKTPSGGVLIQDYKTGNWKVSKKSVPTNLQLGLYAIAARHFYPDLWPIRGELYYLRKGEVYGHTYTHEELDALEHTIVRVCNDIVRTSDFGYTKDTFMCTRLCDFGKSGVCPRGAGIVRKYGR